VDDRRGRLRLIASRDDSDGSVTIHQNVKVYDALLTGGEEVSHRLGGYRHVWVQVVKGAVSVNGTPLGTGDGAALSRETYLTIKAREDAEILLFDLA
jgi:redox-sensitive bicupin YhaK (pirin superfamily)